MPLVSWGCSPQAYPSWADGGQARGGPAAAAQAAILFQGEKVFFCYEVQPAQPAVAEGEFPPPSLLAQGPWELCALPPLTLLCSVHQCFLETWTQGTAQLPRLALDVTACEVMKVLQLSDSAIVPISYLVPRKVNRPSCPHGRRWVFLLWQTLFTPAFLAVHT